MATATAFAIAATVISAGVSTFAAVQSGQAQKDAAEFNASVARNDAIAAQQETDFEVRQLSRRNKLRSAARTAKFAASGVEIGGSAADVSFDSAVQDELDILSAFYRGEIRSGSSKSQAELFRTQGRSAVISSSLAAGSTILGGFGSALEINATRPQARSGQVGNLGF